MYSTSVTVCGILCGERGREDVGMVEFETKAVFSLLSVISR